jgi:hypothetical protein
MLNRRASSRKSQGADFFMAIRDEHLSELTLRRLHDPIPYSADIEYVTPSDSEHVSVPLIEASGKKGNVKGGSVIFSLVDCDLTCHYPIPCS